MILKDAPAVKLLLLMVLGGAALVLVFLIWMVATEYHTTVNVSGKELAYLREKGWVPQEIPDTITAFHKGHSMDTDHQFMMFDMPGSLDDYTSGVCVRSEERPVAAKSIGRWLAWWWPSGRIRSGVTEDKWPLYECRFANDNYSFWLTAEDLSDNAETEDKRLYMWRKSDKD